MQYRLLSCALAWASLLGPVYSRPDLDDALINVDELDSPANLTIEAASLGPDNLLRRQDEEEDESSSMCRGLCDEVSWLGMSVGDDGSSGDASLSARGLFKRALTARPAGIRNINNYVVGKFEALSLDILRRQDWGGTSSGFLEFGTERLSLGAQQLCGCTILAVVSEEAVYMAHFFENMSFDTKAGKRGAKVKLRKSFDKNVIGFLHETTPPMGKKNRNLGLAGVKSKLQTGVRAFIMTPQAEKDEPVAQGATNNDVSVTYVEGLNYMYQIMQLKDTVNAILGEEVPVTVIQYQAINQEDKRRAWRLDKSAKGRALFEYGGTKQELGMDRARLWVETSVVWSWVYQKDPETHTTVTNHVPIEGGIHARQEDLAEPTATSQKEETTVLPSVTKVVIGQTTLTLGPTPRVVTISGNLVTLQSEAVVMANRTMSLQPEQSEAVLTNQGIVLTIERDSTSGLTSATTDLPLTTITSGTVTETSPLTPTGPSSTFVSSTKTETTLSATTSVDTASITNTNPFPSTVFSLPPVVTTTSTSTGSDGSAVVVTMTGTTDSSGVVVPVSTLQSAEASSSASALVSQLSAVSSAVSAFSADPTNTAKATAAVNAIHDAQSSNSEFGRDLGIAAAGLCFVFCSTVAGAAGALGSLEVGVSGVIAGTASVGALGGLVGAVGAAAAALDDKTNNDQASGITSRQTTKAESSTSTCKPTTVTDFQVQCATGLANGASTTSCSTVSTIVVTSCSATATTATTYQSGFCPLSREDSGPIATFSYDGYQDQPIETTIFLTDTVTVNVTMSSTMMPTGTSLTSDIPTTTDLTTTGSSTSDATSPLTPATGSTTTERSSTQLTTSVESSTSLSTSVDTTSGSFTSLSTTTSSVTTSLSTTLAGTTALLSTSTESSTTSIKTSTTSIKPSTTSIKSTTKSTKTTTTSKSSSTTSVKPACPSATQACTNCNGRVTNGKATCRGGDADGCACNPSADTPGFSCGAQKSCELNNCDGSYANGKATCQNAFKGCECTPSTKTPGFTCGAKKSCEANNCNGSYSNGEATCQNAFKGCECLPSTSTPGFSCGSKKSCESNNCDGYYSNGKAYCTNAFKGCECKASKNTNGFSCGTAKSCELNGCGGTSDDNGNATCQNAFKGCECLPSTSTPGFSCGTAKSCQSNGCNGRGSYASGAYCQDAFKGCKCTPNSSTPGFCGSLVQCSFSGCNGVAVSGKQLGVCQTDSHKGCSCILSSQPTTLASQPSTAPQTGPSWVLRLWGDQTCKANSVPFLQQPGNGPSKCIETYGNLRSWCAPKDTWPSSLKVLFYDKEGCQGNPLTTLTSNEKGCPGEIQAFVGCYENDNLKSFQVVNA